MNERLRELVKQAEKLAEDELVHLERVHNRLYSFTESREIYNQKFAELIVRECMEQVWYTREDSINGNVSEVIKERMKQHFEVEQ